MEFARRTSTYFSSKYPTIFKQFFPFLWNKTQKLRISATNWEFLVFIYNNIELCLQLIELQEKYLQWIAILIQLLNSRRVESRHQFSKLIWKIKIKYNKTNCLIFLAVVMWTILLQICYPLQEQNIFSSVNNLINSSTL